MELCSKKTCVGCFACRNICPKGAISVGEDELLKTIPVIDADKCVDCGLCQKVCPVLNKSNFVEPQTCYAAWSKKESDRRDCASGGIATALSRMIIRNGGKVFGSVYGENLDVKIEVAETEDDLEKFKGSKYVQSYTGDSYKEVKALLESGSKVLYIGTPCQIDGLLCYLRNPYSNLYTVDIICHGVPPAAYLKQYVEKLLPGKKIDSVTFRGKDDYYFCAYEEQKLVYKKRDYADVYFESFLRGVDYRDNCYTCQYARRKRVSDITIGDFWGLDKASLNIPYDGKVSVILTNTEKGEKLLQESKECIYFEKRHYEEAIAHNEQLKSPISIPKEREIFCANLEKGVYKALFATDIGKNIKKELLRNFLPVKIIRKLMRRK